MELNEPQHRAVVHTDGPLLVFAGAGSGKTRVITYRIANLIANHRVPPYRILAVTFTNKAAGEMKDRLSTIAGPEIASDLWVGTFHSICCRLLRRYADEVGLTRSFVIYDDADQKAVINRIVKARDLDDRRYPPKLLLSRIHRQKQEGTAPADVPRSPVFDEETRNVYAEYEAALRTSNAVDFDDLLLHILRLLENPTSVAGRELRERFDYLLVDEFQDTNAIQYRLVRAFAARTQNLCVVGDDDQSIYSWRGADIRNIRGFRNDFPGAHVVRLEQNYRSSGNIVAAALGVISEAVSREPKELWTEREDGEEIRIVATRDERDEALQVVARIQAEVAEGAQPENIAIFYRVNAQSRVLEEACRTARLPYQIIGGMRFFERAEVKDVMAYLRVIENPRSDTDLLRIINVPARGIGNKTVERVLQFADRRGSSVYDAIEPLVHEKGLTTGTKKKLLAFRELIEGLRNDALHASPSKLAEQVLTETAYLRALKEADTAEADARLENLQEFVQSIQEYEEEVAESGAVPTLSEYMERVSLVADIDQAESGPTVLMMTVHSAKGLEFDSVYLTGLEEEMFPYRGLDSDKVDELEEERRLMYVAITRAKRRLTITHAAIRTIFGTTRYGAPSRFLSHIPEERVRREGHAFASRPLSSGFASRYGDSGGYGVRRNEDWEFSQLPADEFEDAPLSSEQNGETHRIDYAAFDDVPTTESLRVGARVVHQRFGRGIISRVGLGSGERVVARFPGYGERKVLASYLRFE